MIFFQLNFQQLQASLGGNKVITDVIKYMKKLLDSDWLGKDCKNVKHKCKKV